MQRGQPLAFWGLMLGMAGLWTAARWPALAARHQQLAAALIVPGGVPGAVPGPHGPDAAVMLAAAPADQRVEQTQTRSCPACRRTHHSRPVPRQAGHERFNPADVALGVPAAQPELPADIVLAASAPAPAPATATAPVTAFRLADTAYARLAAGQRRQAAALFDAALALEPANRQWQQQRAALRQRWQLGSFSLLRDGGAAGPAASPVLGGGQVGASIAYLPDPLAQRPLALVARANAAAGNAGVDAATAVAAIGLRQTLRPGITLSAERLIALGAATRGDWTLRLAAGGQHGRLDGYGEAGVLGSGAIYAGGQASARLFRLGPATVAAGSWASLQTGLPDVWRVDIGPQFSAQWQGVRLAADWRQRVAGNAAPGSGPVVTISAGF